MTMGTYDTSNILLTVATPTYNRAHTLPACYESLCGQSDKRFIWLVIDDGSTDQTENLVAQWIQEGKIRIEYIKKPNGGKASALNVGIEHLKTEYAVCLDSDDVFFPTTIENASKELEAIKNCEKYCGILALRHKPDGAVMGNQEIPPEYDEIKAEDIFLRLRLRTELICFYKVSVLKQYRFPEFAGEKFVSPAWMQYEITQRYSFKVSRSKLCQCEYYSDGLTRNKRKVIKRNPKGYTCVKRYSFDLSPTLGQKIKHGIMYDCGCIIAKDREMIKNVKHKILAILLLVPAFVVFLMRFKNEKK